jgi:hypothetical protein
VDARDKRGHDAGGVIQPHRNPPCLSMAANRFMLAAHCLVSPSGRSPI